jgi:AcrR family transcriptional regulator
MSIKVQEKILKTAIKLFYSQGIRATGVDAIVKEAKIAKMSLYKHYRSKDELILAYLRKQDDDFRTWFIGRVEGIADTPEGKLLAIFDVNREWINSPEFRGCAIISASAEFPLEGNPIQQVAAESYDKFRNYMANLANQCGFKFPSELAMQLSLLIEGSIISEQMERHSGAAEQAKEVAILLIGSSMKVVGTSKNRCW